jgi:hypothetical protein
MSQTPTDPKEELIADREKLIAQMEKDLARPRVVLLRPVAVLGVVAGLTLAWWMKDDATYFSSDPNPIELGAEGDYHFDRAVSNRYAQVHGAPSLRGWYVEGGDEIASVVVGLTDTPLLVKRVTFADENRRLPDGKRPQPRQNPFFARGRLLSRADAGKYEEIFREYKTWSGVEPSWILLAEQPPGKDLKSMAMFGFVIVFAIINAWLLVRSFALRRG